MFYIEHTVIDDCYVNFSLDIIEKNGNPSKMYLAKSII